MGIVARKEWKCDGRGDVEYNVLQVAIYYCWYTKIRRISKGEGERDTRARIRERVVVIIIIMMKME